MVLSTGISEINYLSQNKNLKKVYLWPKYNAGKINKINKITKRSDSNNLHINNPSTDLKKTAHLTNTPFETLYNIKGMSYNTTTMPQKPGSFLDVIA